jgi:glycine cleavage system H lipoate-binding protein
MHAVIEGLKYMPSHEWTKVEGDVATVGITDHAQVRPGRRDAVGACAKPRIEREEARGRGGGVRERTRDDSCD